MKSLTDYIEQEYIKTESQEEFGGLVWPRYGFGSFNDFLDENLINEPTQKDIDTYCECMNDIVYHSSIKDINARIYKDLNSCLNEMLQSVSSDRIIKELKKKYEDKIESLTVTDERKQSVRLIGDKNIFDGYFEDLVNKFNYYVTVSPRWDERYKKYMCIIEPKYADIVTDEVHTKYHSKLYHMTDESKVDSILKTGLRLKKNDYREYEKRIFLFCAEDDEQLNKCIDYIKKVKHDYDHLVLLEIDMKDTNVDFYKDTMMNDKNGFFCYTYAYIHPNRISKY